MSRQTNGQRQSLRTHQQCRDIEDGLLADNGINLWRVLIGVLVGATFGALGMTLWVELTRVFA